MRALIARLGSDETAWSEFLETYAPRILQVIRLCERDADAVSDAFLWVCERLVERQCSRLRRFDPDGTARFTTWLGVVVHNLCRDWRRAVTGRRRIGELVARMTTLDRAVFGAVVERGLPIDRAAIALRQSFPGVSESAVQAAGDRVHERIAAALARRGPNIALTLDDPTQAIEPADEMPNPETAILHHEDRRSLARALKQLGGADRVLLRLRYQADLTLAEVAQASGLKDAQTADRRIRHALARLRQLMSVGRASR